MTESARPGDAIRLLRLSDGRKLAWSEFGAPDGFPTFYFHGTPGSRLEGAFADPAARRHGYRIIALDRPGFGRSTFQPGRTFADWPADVLAVADVLGLTEFGVIGHSGGGPHLFACAVLLPPARLTFVGALGPWGPLASPEIASSLNRVDRFYATTARAAPWAMQATFAPLGWAARWPCLFFGLMRSAVSAADRAALAGELLRQLEESELEAFRQGGRGAAHEATIAYRDWGFDLADIRVPVRIRLGTEDTFVPTTMGDYLARTIPGVDFRWLPGRGHFELSAWDDILAAGGARG